MGLNLGVQNLMCELYQHNQNLIKKYLYFYYSVNNYYLNIFILYFHHIVGVA